MNLFRNLLFWLLLALVGALLAQVLLQDPGYVLVRFRGTDYTTSVAAGLAILVAVLAVLWLVWKVLTLPFRAWQGHRDKKARSRLTEGSLALQQGHWNRAEKLLTQAASDADVEAMARLGAVRAADARGDDAAAVRQLDAFGERHPVTRALATAERALAQDRPTDALVALDTPAAQPLPPRGLSMRADALALSGQATQAYGLLGPMRKQQALPKAQLDELEARLAEASLLEADDANILAERWEALPKPLKSESGVVAAYARRAAALRWNDAALKSLEQALDKRWDEELASLYGQLPVGQDEARTKTAERWLKAHPSSPALLLTLARLARAQGHGTHAADYLQRALGQGAGNQAWEELGHVQADAGDDHLARLSYANALRVARDETPVELPNRDLRQEIHDAAVTDERDEYGFPRRG